MKTIPKLMKQSHPTPPTWSTLPSLGVGLGFRHEFLAELFQQRAQVDFLEIITEHYLTASPEKQQELQLLQRHFTLIPHGISLSLGSAEGLDLAYLEKLAALMARINPPWWSEHIALTFAGGVDIGHLTPLPFTNEAVEVIARNVETIRRYIKTPLLLENITYLFPLPGAEMTEAAFLRRVLEATDCGMLLDITNLYINAHNHHYSIAEFLNELPLERVVQLHFVGGEQHQQLLLDTHSQAVPPPIWNLMAQIATAPNLKGMILERDDNFPQFTELTAELHQARQIWQASMAKSFIEPSGALTVAQANLEQVNLEQTDPLVANTFVSSTLPTNVLTR
jgi:uncharacterized protein